MNSFAYHTLRLGLAITFIWIGIFIVRDPVAWGGFLQPWAVDILPISVERIMFLAGITNIVIGVFILFGWLVWFVSFIAFAHLVLILITSGIDAVLVRDIGLMGASLALSIEAFRRR